jgi:hypothetical protein
MNRHADFDPRAPDRPLLAEDERLTAAHLTGEQEHRRQRVRRHLRFLHGWGVVCGMRVVAAGDAEHPWSVVVCPGYALGPYGDEILVANSVSIDIRESSWKAPVLRPSHAFVVVRYAESHTDPAVVRPADCGCGGSRARPTRTRDGFAVEVLWERPTNGLVVSDPCGPDREPCPDCPESPYVVLACVDLPDDESTPIMSAHIRFDECHGHARYGLAVEDW